MSASAVPAESAEVHEASHTFVGLNAILIVSVISLCMFLSHLLRKARISWLSDSGVAMLLGVLIGCVVNLFGWNTSHRHLMLFEPELFFFLLLPPIIFDAGYSMQREAFFANVGSILLFAVFGTLTSTLVVGYGLFGLAKLGIVGLDADSPMECLLFGSLLAAVDPVAVLSTLQRSKLKSPVLLSLIFGESVLNDAVSIVLFHTFAGFHGSTNAGKLHRANANGGGQGGSASAATSADDDELVDHFTILSLFVSFVLISLGSLLIGVGVGLACSFLFRHSRLRTQPEVEFTLVIFAAYLAYCFAEISGLSGIMSLFFCSIVLAHYGFFSLSPTSQSTTRHAFKSFALMSETFLFGYLGLSAVVSVKSVLHLEWSLVLIVATMGLCVIARGMHIFPLSLVSNLCTDGVSSGGESARLTFSMQLFLWFCSIRGAIAFALSLSVFTAHRGLIISSTMMIVISSTLVLGGLTSPMLRRLGLVHEGAADGDHEVDFELVHQAENNESAAHSPLEHGDETMRLSFPASSSSTAATLPPASHPRRRARSGSSSILGDDDEHAGFVSRMWRRFDEHYMQSLFGGYAHQLEHTTHHRRARGNSCERSVASNSHDAHFAHSDALELMSMRTHEEADAAAVAHAEANHDPIRHTSAPPASRSSSHPRSSPHRLAAPLAIPGSLAFHSLTTPSTDPDPEEQL